MAAAAGMAKDRPPAQGGVAGGCCLTSCSGGFGRLGAFTLPRTSPAHEAASEGRSACPGLFMCNPVLFALPSSSDAVTWADPDRWKPPEDVGDPQGVEAGKSLEP